MTAWLVATVALLPALAVPVFVACRGGSGDRLAAVQLAISLATLILVMMSFAFDQSSFIPLPLALVLLGLPGMLVLAHFLERWL
ncbi:MAG TPA: monovalent cation/H+ antiporter complex subunit F [Acetobacteraceae bacterium]|nr:monovalent cation/H+ antiporter complex subunit F [Acetobacteraceae bacterium]